MLLTYYKNLAPMDRMVYLQCTSLVIKRDLLVSPSAATADLDLVASRAAEATPAASSSATTPAAISATSPTAISPAPPAATAPPTASAAATTLRAFAAHVSLLEKLIHIW